MLLQLRRYIEKNQLLNQHDRILLAVSGGADSMVMLHLFQRLEVPFIVAHCNFNLRGAESNADEDFVRNYCTTNGLELHVTQFATNHYAEQHRISIELAARELRYGYFDELRSQQGCSKVAVAHNLNDSAETVILNLSRGTGIRGLTGIKPINGNIIRPLLFATRAEIEQYAQQFGIDYRTDSTNAQTVYRRNHIRHNVIPQLQLLNQSVDHAIVQTADRLCDVAWLVDEQLRSIRERAAYQVGDCLYYRADVLLGERIARLFMVEELEQYGFSPPQAEQAAELLVAEVGRRVESSTHVIYRDREVLILSPKLVEFADEIEIDHSTSSVVTPIALTIEHWTAADVMIDRDPNVALLDLDKLLFPLKLRTWRHGDRFSPFGMKGQKKVSDFLVDKKVPLHAKSTVYVITSANGQIAWLVGFRPDSRFCLTPSTKRVLRIKLVK